MTKITVYGGTGTIGGNQILVEDERGAFFLDFGMPFAERNRYYEEFLKPRAGSGLLDPLTLGLLPPLEGLYRSDLEPTSGLWGRFRDSPGYRRLEEIEGVLVSHAHMDHCGYISFLREDIPIYASVMTSILLKAIQDSSVADIEREITYFAPREVNKDGYLATLRGQRRQRPFTFLLTQNDSAFPKGEPVETFPQVYDFWNSLPGSSRVELQTAPTRVLPQVSTGLNGRGLHHYPVDHSILGATGYAVETAEGWIVYTGDLRFHGSQPGLMEEFVQGVAALKPLALITEGTHTEPGVPPVTEQHVHDRAMGPVRDEKGLVVADFGPRNMERLLTFNGIAEFSNRRLVITTKDAFLLEAMGKVWRQFPPLNEVATIAIYDETRGQRQGWDKGIRERYGSLLIGPEEVRADPGGYILCFSFWDIKHLIDIDLRGGLYIYSSSEVYDEEQGFDVDRLRAWLDHFEMKALGLPRRLSADTPKWETPVEERDLHASGHASYDELLNLIREIKPRYLVPVHTQNPGIFAESLRGEDIKVMAPTKGVALSLT